MLYSYMLRGLSLFVQRQYRPARQAAYYLLLTTYYLLLTTYYLLLTTGPHARRLRALGGGRALAARIARQVHLQLTLLLTLTLPLLATHHSVLTLALLLTRLHRMARAMNDDESD